MRKTRILLSAFLISIMVMGMSITVFAAPEGNGSESNPFKISTFTEGEFVDYTNGELVYIINDTNAVMRYTTDSASDVWLSATDTSLQRILNPGQKGGWRVTGEAGDGFYVKQLDLPSANPDPAPVSPEQQHVQHAEKAEMLPVKNTDGSYKLNAYGVPVIVCSECGQVHSDFAVAHEAWLDEVEKAVKNHKNFGTDWKAKEEAAENPVTITTSTFISFDKDMLSYLNSQPDAVILKFKYLGKYYVTTIPSDFDCLSLADENGWAGFAYIMSICGGREISEEEFKM